MQSDPNKGRCLPDLPTNRPLPDVPPTVPWKTPPPSRRINIDAQPPLPPVNPQSMFLDKEKRERVSLPEAIPPPLPPRKISMPTPSLCATTNHQNSSTYDCPRPTDSASLYNVPRSAGISNSSLPSYDSLSVSSSSSKVASRIPSPSVSYTTISESMSLQELVDKHQYQFPLQVEVSAGYFGESERDTFSEGDLLNFHFIKQVSVAVIESCNGQKIKIPLNSAAQFSVLYNPNNNMKEALAGFMFKSVRDILAQKNMPKIVCATKQHSSSNVAHSVVKGELIMINEVKHGRFGGQSLVCTTLGTEKQKRLSESCQGYFSTKPCDLKLYLPELTKKFQLPLQVVVAELETSTNESPFSTSEVVKIVGVEKEITLIATPLLGDDAAMQEDDHSSIMFEIPVNLDVMEVTIIEQVNNDEFEKLYVDTRQLLDSYDPSKLDKQVRIGHHNDIYYTSVREEEKNAGIELLASEAIYSEPTIWQTKSSNTTTDTSPQEKIDETDKTSSQNATDVQQPPQIVEHSSSSHNSLEETTQSANHDDYYPMSGLNVTPTISPVPSPVQYLGTSMHDVPLYMISKMMENVKHDETQREMKDVQNSIATIRQQLESLQHTVTVLQTSISGLEKHFQNVNYVEIVPSRSSSIYGMSCVEVLAMLDKLNLGQYKHSFENEEINGALLSELDEDTLKNELGITSKIHRKKLMLVIQGNQTYQHLVADP